MKMTDSLNPWQKGGTGMENIMIVSSSEKGTTFFSDILTPMSACQITAVKSCGEARRILMDRDFDLVIVDSPLRDETGESFAHHVASNGITQVILVVKKELYEEMASACERDGILTVAKPINKYVFWSALSLARAAHNRIKKVHSENTQLKQKIEDIRIVDRAKCLLISLLGMSEKEAHRYLEKQAMDMRITKREVAERILNTYEN